MGGQAIDMGEHIRALRCAQGLSQKELGEKIGVRGDRISRWELGRCSPRPMRRRQLAEALGVAPEILYLRGAERRRAMEEVFADVMLKIARSDKAAEVHKLIAAKGLC